MTNLQQRLFTSRICLMGALSLLILGASEVRSETGAPSSPESGSYSSSLNLIQDFPGAHDIPPLMDISFAEESDWSALSHGWHALEKTANDTASYSWSTGSNSSIDISLLRVAPIEVHLDVEPPIKPKVFGRNQSLRLFWNGTEVGRHVLNWERAEYVVKIPPEVQRIGPNFLEMRPSYWFWNDRVGIGSGRREQSLRVWNVRFKQGTMNAEHASAPSMVLDGTLFQSVNSVITYYYILPKEARIRLHGEVKFDERSEAPGSWPMISIVLTQEGGRQTILKEWTEQDLENDAILILDASLENEPNTPVAISLIVSSPPSHSTPARNAHAQGILWKEAAMDWPPLVDKRVVPDDLRGRYNVVVVLFDSLRADHTEPYGSTRAQTPVIRQLSEKGVSFLRAHANSSWTRTSVTSFMSGQYPWKHGVQTYEQVLPAELPYLPEVLSDAGYATIGISNNGNVTEEFHYNRGFQHFYEILREEYRTEARRILDPRERAAYIWNRCVEPHIPQNAETPFFLYLHEIDPHHDYRPPRKYADMYNQGSPVSDDISDIRGNWLIQNLMELGPAELRHFNGLYCGEVTFMDGYLGWILDHLEEAGLAQNTLVVFLSDHGEEFMDHGGIYHGRNLYQEQLLVPFIFSLPSIIPQGIHSDAPVELTDLPRTLLDLLNIPAPLEMGGTSILADLTYPEIPGPARPLMADLALFPPVEESSVVLDNWKLIDRRQRDGGIERFLYDLSADPGELYNRFFSEPMRARALLALMATRRAMDQAARAHAVDAGGDKAEDTLDPEIRANLEALGYLQ